MVKIKRERLLIEPKNIRPSSKDFEVIGVLNPAAVRMPDGKIMLYARVIEKLRKYEDKKYVYAPRMVGKKNFKIKLDKFNRKLIKHESDLDFVFKDGTKRLTFISHFRRIILDSDGFNIVSIDKKPSFFGVGKDGELGVEDARITKIDDIYVMTYVTLSRNENISTSLATSKDCVNWERKGIIFGEQDKDVVIFPEKVNGKYIAFDRPEGNFQFSPPHIWIAESSDLISWGKLRSINLYKRGDEEFGRNGAGPPPIKTDKGWLLLYHTAMLHKIDKRQKEFLDLAKKVFKLKKGDIKRIHFYSVGAALFDLKKPNKLKARSKTLIIVPTKEYDIGTFEDKRVVFPTGLIYDECRENLLIYSGGGDIVTTVKEVALKDVLDSLSKV